MLPGTIPRTVISAMHPRRYEDSFTEIYLEVWFEELNEPVTFCATPFDCERHGVYLWITAMRGDYGPVEVLGGRDPRIVADEQMRMLEVQAPRLLEYHQHG